MNELLPDRIAHFLKSYQISRGIIRRFRVSNNNSHTAKGQIDVTAREISTHQKIRIRFMLEGVLEYRFQRRLNHNIYRIPAFRIGYFDGLIYLNFDAYEDELAPRIHDFRASDIFIAARKISWLTLAAQKPGSDTH